MTDAIELRDLACVRGRRTLFQNLQLRLAPGQLLRVTGANGAGKTSLLRMLCGLLAPSHGSVWWRERPLAAQRDDFHRQLLYVGHAAALKDDLSALENLRASEGIVGRPCSDAAALQALAEAGLRGREHLAVRHLSQGQRRRAALARLPLSRARLWVLDEPFNALDAAATAWLCALLARHVGDGGLVVLTSHQELALGTDVPQLALAL